jgi:hypothetical protein
VPADAVEPSPVVAVASTDPLVAVASTVPAEAVDASPVVAVASTVPAEAVEPSPVVAVASTVPVDAVDGSDEACVPTGWLLSVEPVDASVDGVVGASILLISGVAVAAVWVLSISLNSLSSRFRNLWGGVTCPTPRRGSLPHPDGPNLRNSAEMAPTATT